MADDQTTNDNTTHLRPDMYDDYADGTTFENDGPSPEKRRHSEGWGETDDMDDSHPGVFAPPSSDADADADMDEPGAANHDGN